MVIAQSSLNISQLVQEQRKYYSTGVTKSLSFRQQQLTKLKNAIGQRSSAIVEALAQDLGKPTFEAYLELAVLKDINHALKNLPRWMKPKSLKTGIELFPSSAKLQPEPLGVVLIIGAWNYPFSLIISPLIGAIAAGNCIVLKPSEFAPHISQVLTELIRDTFPPEYIAIQEGGVEVAQELLEIKFDHILFTGSTNIGRIVMEAAAKNLTPVTLELGGKSPCLVDTNINVREAAKRITWGKFLNAGQTCIAPDYILVNREIKADLIREMKRCLNDFFGDNPASSPDYGRIINSKQFERLRRLLTDGTIVIGGESNAAEKYIAPTILNDVSVDAPIMQEEIFGPILPVLEYQHLAEAIAFVNSKPKPLALYFFSRDRDKQEQVLQQTSSGGVCLNETMMHSAVRDLPFGGVGNSGMGAYHGKVSFDTFSHYKSVVTRPFWGDLNWRYAPYQEKTLKLFQNMFLQK